MDIVNYLERIGYLGPVAHKQMDVAAYLERIDYSGPLTPSPETLRKLHRAHLFTVPFENLDISSGRKVLLDEDALVRKVVEKRRGGFCYELNGAFAALLRRLGFRVTLLSARVARRDGGMSPEFDHLTLRVDLDEPWLADVGFGDSFLEPLVLKPRIEQQQGDREFRIVENDAGLTLQRAERFGIWKPEYSFDLRPRRLHEFVPMCDYHQTSPESHFTQKRLCTMATLDGRITLSETRFIVTRSGIREEAVVESEAEWKAILREQFGVRLPGQIPIARS
ncbi:MAG: N-acetyltransferase [Candidatus Angelobacter sp.]|nr:N-acetyltransferase [Candidatus Angelobacter sp.]